jgi:hypothetical protein
MDIVITVRVQEDFRTALARGWRVLKPFGIISTQRTTLGHKVAFWEEDEDAFLDVGEIQSTSEITTCVDDPADDCDPDDYIPIRLILLPEAFIDENGYIYVGDFPPTGEGK